MVERRLRKIVVSASPTTLGDALPPAPERAAARVNLYLGVATAVLGGLPVVLGASYGAGTLVAFSGALNVYVGWRTARDGNALQRIRAAQDRHASGRRDEAVALLGEARLASTSPVVARLGLLAEASFALADGEHARAVEVATDALERAPRPRLASFSRAAASIATWSTDASLLGVRALARALAGDDEGARADAVALDAHLGRRSAASAAAPTSPTGGARGLEVAVARVRLAESIGFARRADRDGLARHLTAHRALITRELGPHERALVRGFDQLLATPSPSPYRAGRGASTDDESAAWAGELLARAATTDVPAAPGGAGGTLAHLGGAAGPMGKPAGRDWASLKRIGIAVGFAVFMAAFGVALIGWQASARSLPAPVLLAMLLAPLAAFLAWVILGARKATAQRATLAELRLRIAASPGLEGARVLAEHAKSSEPLTRAHANLVLAHEANADGAFALALQHAEQGLVPLQSGMLGALAGPSLVPSLVAERALAKAALGRADDAIADVSTIPDGVAFRTRAALSVRLVAAARAGDHAEAATHARRIVDAPIAVDAPIELLARLAVAVDRGGDVGLGELGRLRHDAAPGQPGRAWLDQVAPTLIAALDTLLDQEADRERSDARADEEAEAEREAELVAEAAPPARLTAR